jgi:hypothetical protein
MKKILIFLKQKNNAIITAVIVIILILLAIVYFQHKKIANLNDKYQSEVKLKNALVDTAKVYKNKENEWVTEKLTLQGSLKLINDVNNHLTASEQELTKRVKEAEKNNSVITAALIQTKVELDSLKSGKVIINDKDSSIAFADSTKNIKYNIEILHVRPISLSILPIMKFNKFELPNKQFVNFFWGDKKKDYPISFSVSNSNDYFKTVNIDSYAIPQLQKDVVNPSAWGKITAWIKKSGGFIITVGVSGAAGAGLYAILHK